MEERKEDAGASIVNHASEFATRAMYSADEEPELPSSVQDLIRRLEGQAEPITWLPDLSGPEFRDFFPERPLLGNEIPESMIVESEVRSRRS